MSHISRIKTLIKDHDAIMAALADLGYNPVHAETGTMQFRQYDTTQVVIKFHILREFKNEYGYPRTLARDFGFAPGADDTLDLVGDFWHFECNQEQITNEINQRYAYHVAVNQLALQGYVPIEETAEDGSIRLVLQRI